MPDIYSNSFFFAKGKILVNSMYDLQEIKSRISGERDKNRRDELLGFLAQHFRTETFKMIHNVGMAI